MYQNTCSIDHTCVTCSDAGTPVRVLSVEGDDALCEDTLGNRARVAVELVSPVREGETLLEHGGVAIGRIGEADPKLSADSRMPIAPTEGGYE
jgi:hydrogenase expression/formation protein HypC